MSSKTINFKPQRPADKYSPILLTIIQIFMEQWRDQITNDKAAKATDISREAVSNYFNDEQALQLAIIESLAG